MLDFLFGTRTKVLDIDKTDLLHEKYFNTNIRMPFDINTLHIYLEGISINGMDKHVTTPKVFKEYSVYSWISDKQGYVYNVNTLLYEIYLFLNILKKDKDKKIMLLALRIEVHLDILELDFKYKRVKKN